jgi:hypothetical protein
MEAEHPRGDWEPARVPAYAVIRFDPSRSGVEHQVMVWEVLADIEEAESEVEHLNAQVPANRETSYFLAGTCFYPEGRRTPPESWGRRAERAPARKPVGPPAPRERMEREWEFLVEAADGAEGQG